MRPSFSMMMRVHIPMSGLELASTPHYSRDSILTIRPSRNGTLLGLGFGLPSSIMDRHEMVCLCAALKSAGLAAGHIKMSSLCITDAAKVVDPQNRCCCCCFLRCSSRATTTVNREQPARGGGRGGRQHPGLVADEAWIGQRQKHCDCTGKS